MKTLDIISIFVVLANLSLGTFVWWKGKKKKANILFFLLMIAVSLWSIANYLALQDFNSNTILFWVRVVMAMAVIQCVAFLMFIRSFIKLEIHIKKVWLIIYLILCVSTIIVVFSSLLFSDIKFENDHRIPVVAPGILLFLIITVGSLVGGFVLLMRQYTVGTGIIKMQTRYILFGAAIMFILLLVFNFGFVVLLKNSNFVSFGPLFILPFTVLTSYAVLRYRLMDIRIVLHKGVVHFISIAIILFLYIYLLFFVQRFLVDQHQWNERSSLIILVLLIALAIEPLRRFLFKVVDKVFYSKQKNAREEAKKLRLALSSSMQFDQLVKKVRAELQSYLDTQTVQFLWNNKRSGRLENYYKDETPVSFSPTDPLFHYLQEHPDVLITEEIPYMVEEASSGDREILLKISENLKKIDVGLVCPIGEKGELVGAFFFGPKARKEAFTSDNVQYLAGLQFSLTGAMANALLYKQAVERIARLQ